MQMGWAGLVKTVVLTATLTSAAWIGGVLWWSSRNDSPPMPAPRHAAGADSDARPERASLIVPVAGVRADQLADTFTQARSGGRVHDAIDIMAPRGTPVVAAASGTVEKLFLSNAGGNTIYLRLPGGRTIHYYAHLDSYAPGLAEGQAIRRGAPLGRVGSTGNASPDAPHLHFAVIATDPGRKWYEDGRAINPFPLLAGPRGAR